MAITRLTKHDNHPVRIQLNEPGKMHYAELRCATCDEHIQWLNRQQAHTIKEMLND